MAGADGSMADAPPDWGLGGSMWEAGGGTGAGGSTPADSGLPAEHAWLADPEIWKPVPGTDFLEPNCRVRQGDSAKLKFPPLSWQSCGSGCAMADLVQGFEKGGVWANNGASTHPLGQEASGFLAVLSLASSPADFHSALRVVDLDSGQTLGSVQTIKSKSVYYSACQIGGGSGLTGGIVGGGIPNVKPALTMPITFRPSDTSWVWAQPPLENPPQGLTGFDLDYGSIRFQTGKGAVWAMMDPAVHDWTLLEGNSLSYIGAGQGDLGVWVDSLEAGKQKLKAWAPDGKGIRVLLDPAAARTCMIAVGPQSLVGVVTDAASCSDFGNMRLFKMPRAYTLAAAAPVQSPLLNLPSLPLALNSGPRLKVWGDYAAAYVTELGDAGYSALSAYFIVVRLSDWKAWRVDPSANRRIHNSAWTVTDQYLYFGETGTTVSEAQWATELRRVELSLLDQAATPLGS